MDVAVGSKTNAFVNRVVYPDFEVELFEVEARTAATTAPSQNLQRLILRDAGGGGVARAGSCAGRARLGRLRGKEVAVHKRRNQRCMWRRKGGSVQDRFSHGRSPVTRLPVPESQGLGLVAATRTMDVGDYAAHCYPMFFRITCHPSSWPVSRGGFW